MIRRFILLTVLCLMFAVPAFAQQGFSAIFYYLPEYGSPLTTVCQGGIPIPDGTLLNILWDNDGNGPDVGDTLAPLCIDPPNCEQGPAGTVNFNQQPFNGMAQSGAPGYFTFDLAFTSSGTITPASFFFRVYDTDGVTPLWTSIVYTLNPGPQEFFVQQADWTCGSGGAQCVVIDETE